MTVTENLEMTILTDKYGHTYHQAGPVYRAVFGSPYGTPTTASRLTRPLWWLWSWVGGIGRLAMGIAMGDRASYGRLLKVAFLLALVITVLATVATAAATLIGFNLPGIA